MSATEATTNRPHRRWRNPVFVLVFVPGAGAWLTVVGWWTWLYFNPITDWVGRQNAMLQEILGTALWGAWVLLVAAGLAAAVLLADRAAGTRHWPVQMHGRGTWRRPN